jgi:hypothetical protein
MNPLRHHSALVAVVLGSAAVGWALTSWWAASARPEVSRRAPVPTKPDRITTFGNDHLDAAIAGIAAAGDAGAQMAAAVALAKQIEPKDFAAFLEKLRRLPAHPAQGLASRTVMGRWVALDPGAALQWCATHDRGLVDEVVDEWARTRPPDQAAALLDRLPAPHHSRAIPRIFETLASHDPEAALALLSRHAAEEAMPRLARTLDALARQDASWLLQRADRLPDHARLCVRVAAARGLVHADAAAAFDWIATQPDRKHLLAGLAESPKHLPSVIAAVAALPHNDQNWQPLSLRDLGRGEATAIIDAIVTHHEQLSPTRLRDMLVQVSDSLARAENPGPLADRLLALGESQALNVDHFVTQWARRSPEDARAWAASLGDESKRRQALDALATVEKVRRHALDAATQPPVSPTAPSLAEKLTQDFQEGRFSQTSQLLTLGESERRQVLEAGFGQTLEQRKAHRFGSPWATLSSHYPAEAARWLARSITADTAADFTQPLVTTATYWAADNPQAAAEWADSLPPGETRAWVAANIVSQWHLIDKTAARAWIESLPPEEHPIAFRTLPGAPLFR